MRPYQHVFFWGDHVVFFFSYSLVQNSTRICTAEVSIDKLPTYCSTECGFYLIQPLLWREEEKKGKVTM